MLSMKDVAACSSWRGADLRTSAGQQNVIVGTCAGPTDAAKAFAELTGKLPPNAGCTLFGDSLLVTLPASDDAA